MKKQPFYYEYKIIEQTNGEIFNAKINEMLKTREWVLQGRPKFYPSWHGHAKPVWAAIFYRQIFDNQKGE